MQRLMLGWSSAGSSLLERLAERPGDLSVLLDDDDRVETLRDEGVDARYLETFDARSVRAVGGPVDSIVVAPEGIDRIRSFARIARRAYPEVFVLACLDREATDADVLAIEEHADQVVQPGPTVAGQIADRAGDEGIRTRKLQRIFRRFDGTIAIVPHDNPDPDAIASAVALRRVATEATADAEVCYFGDINHQENRALVNLLEFDLRNLDPDANLEEFDGIALVDHSRPGVNDSLPPETPIDIVIDHHPPRAPVEARFVDLRSDVGATSTLLVEYLTRLGIEPDAELATGLLYGIRTDTDDFSREVAPADLEAAAELVDRVDHGALERIESPSMTAETLEVLGEAIRSRNVEEDALTTCVGEIGDRDTLAQAADTLLDMEDVRITLVFGYTDEIVFVSARGRGTDADLGSTLRDAFDQIGSAGGHADMAGAQIPIGILLEGDEEADRREVVTDVVTDWFFDALGIEVDRAAADVYADFFGTEFESS